MGTVSITEISDALTALVEEVANQEDDDDEDMNEETSLPKLDQLFFVGQWVRCKIINLQSDDRKTIELSLKPNTVNEDITKVDVTPGVVSGMICTFDPCCRLISLLIITDIRCYS